MLKIQACLRGIHPGSFQAQGKHLGHFHQCRFERAAKILEPLFQRSFIGNVRKVFVEFNVGPALDQAVSGGTHNLVIDMSAYCKGGIPDGIGQPLMQGYKVLSQLFINPQITGMHIATDSTAGERERGSLEPLLVNPVQRGWLIAGKWMAAVAVAWMALLITVVAFGVALSRVPLQDLGVQFRFGPLVAARLLSVALPLALVAVALQIALALFARTFKEAQTYLSAVALLATLPAAFLSLAPLKEAAWMMWVPLLSQALLLGDVMRGEYPPLHWLLSSAGGSLAASAVFLCAAARLLGNERIVFGRG